MAAPRQRALRRMARLELHGERKGQQRLWERSWRQVAPRKPAADLVEVWAMSLREKFGELLVLQALQGAQARAQ
eukprot:410357-Pyramimonas_sp.AAC.1